MTGGALFDMLKSLGPLAGQAREPQVSTTIVKGNRMARISKTGVNIIDLDKETITEIDTAKKTYSVVTFEQMKQAMQDAVARAQNARSKKGAGPAADNPNVETSFDVSAKATGQTKTVSGLEAKEMLITMTMQATDTSTAQSGAMNIVNDSWMASVPGYEEVQAFNRKMGEKMGYLFGSGMSSLGAMQPRTLKGFEEVGKEMAKMEGLPVETTMKMLGQGADSGTGAGAPPPQQNSSNSSNAGAAAAGAALGRLGLGGFGRSKKNNDPPPQQQPPAQGDLPQAQSGALLEMTTTMSGFSAAPADASKFEIPVGYKQVESPTLKRAR
jgi:hypothetical protein